MAAFKFTLFDYKWEDHMSGHDVNEDFNMYINNFLQLYNTYFQVKEYTIKKETY